MGCARLTPQEADVIFFGGSGSKPTKAKAFCENNKCPVQKECLYSAIEEDLDGFWCGTTKDERRVMARLFHKQIRGLDLPPEPKPRRVYRAVVSTYVDTLDYLNTLSEPDIELA